MMKEKLIEAEVRKYLYSKGFVKEMSYSEKVFVHSELSGIKVYVCYVPCKWGVIIKKNDFTLFKHPHCSIKEAQFQIDKLFNLSIPTNETTN